MSQLKALTVNQVSHLINTGHMLVYLGLIIAIQSAEKGFPRCGPMYTWKLLLLK